MTITVPTRKISFEGDALALIDAYAKQHDVSFKDAATDLILKPISVEAAMASQSVARTDVEIAIHNLPDTKLVEELSRRLLDGASAFDFAAATARADAAEARIEALRAALGGDL